MKPNLPVLIAAAALCAPLALTANDVVAAEHVGINAEKGDPARWSEPADTPQRQYANAMKEASAALAEAVAECRTKAAERKDCEARARSQHARDVQEARARARQAPR